MTGGHKSKVRTRGTVKATTAYAPYKTDGNVWTRAGLASTTRWIQLVLTPSFSCAHDDVIVRTWRTQAARCSTSATITCRSALGRSGHWHRGTSIVYSCGGVSLFYNATLLGSRRTSSGPKQRSCRLYQAVGHRARSTVNQHPSKRHAHGSKTISRF